MTNAQASDHLVKFDKALAPKVRRVDIVGMGVSGVDTFTVTSDENEAYIKVQSNNQNGRITMNGCYYCG